MSFFFFMAKVTISIKKNMMLRRYDNLIAWRDNGNTNRNSLLYSVFFFMFYRDYFINKIITKIMHNGKKELSLYIFRKTLFMLKNFFGFQPFFLFKHVAFKMRQLFTIQTKLIRKTRLYTLPLLLTPGNQITYGINHLIKCAKQVVVDEHTTFSVALYIVFLNCFVRTKNISFSKSNR